MSYVWLFRELPWKEKHLDYEIETSDKQYLQRPSSHLKRKASRLRDWNPVNSDGRAAIDDLVLKRKASRLRDWNSTPPRRINLSLLLKRKASRLRDWNNIAPSGSITLIALEKKSISITRLKRSWHRCCYRHNFSWKEKHLDYEIETFRVLGRLPSAGESWSWKEKHLDYEIETYCIISGVARPLHLKRKASRLRDWNE